MFVGEKNAKAIESSDGILALLDGTDADSGASEEELAGTLGDVFSG